MDKNIAAFPKQFNLEPVIKNADKLEKRARFVVGGMGGSHLAADFLKAEDPSLDIIIHSDYGLPVMPEGGKDSLYIAVSHSGNTEETLDFVEQALKKGVSLATVSTGGKLLEFAKANDLPHIVIPDGGLEPRMATGYMMNALLALMDKGYKLSDLRAAAKAVDSGVSEKTSKGAASFLAGGLPLIYASARNGTAAKFMKIVMNETGKTAAFWNVFSELNHNEMMSFTRAAQYFRLTYITDDEDDRRIMKRMDVMQSLVEKRGAKVMRLAIEGRSRFEKLINAMVIAHWTAYHTAKSAGLDPASTALVEEFKGLIA